MRYWFEIKLFCYVKNKKKVSPEALNSIPNPWVLINLFILHFMTTRRHIILLIRWLLNKYIIDCLS